MRTEDYLQKIKIKGIENAGKSFFDKCEPHIIEVTDEEKIVSTACRACIANCGVLAHVRNGRVVSLEGDPRDPMSKGKMCAKGLSGISALYHPNRNKYPLIRVGVRGGGRWRRATWDEALGMIADKLMQVKKDFGAEYVFCSTGGGGNPEIWSIARFCNIFGTPNWFEPGCAQCYLPRVLAATMMYGGADNSIADSNCLEFYDEEHNPIKTLVLWGTDPSFSCPSSGGRMVTVTLNGKFQMMDIKLDPICVDNRDVKMLEDLIVAAHKAASDNVQELIKEKSSSLLGGLDLGALGL